jgi:iron complex outermembrane receptor protein
VTGSLSVFYNVYDHIRTVEPPFPLTVSNLMEGKTYGLEAWTTYEPLLWWRLKGGLTVLRERLRLKPGSANVGIAQEANDPRHQAFLRSEMNLTETVEFDAALRVIGALPNPRVPAYAAVDARLGWNISERVQLSLAGYNLTNKAHPEFVVNTPPRRDVRRSVYATARWSF